MKESSTIKKGLPGAADEVATAITAPTLDVLTEILREGAQRLLAQAIDVEVAERIERHAEVVDEAGRRPVERFGSKILPRYLRKTKAIEELILGCISRA